MIHKIIIKKNSSPLVKFSIFKSKFQLVKLALSLKCSNLNLRLKLFREKVKHIEFFFKKKNHSNISLQHPLGHPPNCLRYVNEPKLSLSKKFEQHLADLSSPEEEMETEWLRVGKDSNFSSPLPSNLSTNFFKKKFLHVGEGAVFAPWWPNSCPKTWFYFF